MTEMQPYAPRHGIDVPLMRKVLEHITANPAEHDQGLWGEKLDPEAVRVMKEGERCGTTACMAGWTLLLTDNAEWVETDPGEWDMRAKIPVGEAARSGVGDRAAELLGLDDHEADAMFHQAFSRAELWDLAANFTHGEIEIPVDLPGGTL